MSGCLSVHLYPQLNRWNLLEAVARLHAREHLKVTIEQTSCGLDRDFNESSVSISV